MRFGLPGSPPTGSASSATRRAISRNSWSSARAAGRRTSRAWPFSPGRTRSPRRLDLERACGELERARDLAEESGTINALGRVFLTWSKVYLLRRTSSRPRRRRRSRSASSRKPAPSGLSRARKHGGVDRLGERRHREGGEALPGVDPSAQAARRPWPRSAEPARARRAPARAREGRGSRSGSRSTHANRRPARVTSRATTAGSLGAWCARRRERRGGRGALQRGARAPRRHRVPGRSSTRCSSPSLSSCATASRRTRRPR